jgi:hypothetical protein
MVIVSCIADHDDDDDDDDDDLLNDRSIHYTANSVTTHIEFYSTQ